VSQPGVEIFAGICSVIELGAAKCSAIDGEVYARFAEIWSYYTIFYIVYGQFATAGDEFLPFKKNR
jgi:hypothetical protein